MPNATNENVVQTAADKTAAAGDEVAAKTATVNDEQNPAEAVKGVVTGLKNKIFGAIKRPS
jgi:hypothetical protein